MGFLRGVSSFERTLVRMRPEVLQVQTGSQIWDHKDQGFDLPRILTSKIKVAVERGICTIENDNSI